MTERAIGRFWEFMLRIMTMDVHLAVFMTIGLSAVHSAVTVINAMRSEPSSGLIFLGDASVNYVAGTLGVSLAVLLIITLARKFWLYSFWLSSANASIWAFTAGMLLMNGVIGGAIMSAFYVAIHTYVALSTKVHSDLRLDSNIEIRRYLEGQK